jgi:CheY-like chemotaxis protein
MKKRDSESQKFLSCLDAIILRKNEKLIGETNSRHRDILKIELAELNSIRSLFISIFKIKSKEPPLQRKTNPTSKDNINALSNNKPNKLPLDVAIDIEEKLSEGTNKPERKVDLKTNEKVKTIDANATMESRKDIRILVVDDEKTIRRYISTILSQEGYNVATANGGAQALEFLHSNSYDLVTTGMIMPDMNGIELLERIRDKYPDIPVIIISAYGTLETVKSVIRFGAFDYLIKPVHPEELRKSIRKALGLQSPK